jgi:hypothetical protein
MDQQALPVDGINISGQTFLMSQAPFSMEGAWQDHGCKLWYERFLYYERFSHQTAHGANDDRLAPHF